jgi:tetratricopeptide (TPR) repeat protein
LTRPNPIGKSLAAVPMTTAAETIALALGHHKAGRIVPAEQLYRSVLAAEPDNPDALHLLGVVLYGRGELAAAIELIGRAIARRGDAPDYHCSLGEALRLAGRIREAGERVEMALRLAPDRPRSRRQLGLIRAAQGHAAAALPLLEEAHAGRPNDLDVLCSLADLRLGAGDPEQAERLYRRCLELGDRRSSVLSNLGLALTDLGHFDEALGLLREAVSREPAHPIPHNNLGLTELLLGDFAAGWRDYQWRLEVPGLDPMRQKLNRPAWTGGDLDGARILLYAEQGVGDVLQFVRYAPLVAARGGIVVLAVQGELRRLLADVAELAPTDELVRFREHIALLSLPLVFGTDLATIPASVPYLRAAPDAVTQWEARLASLEGTRPRLRVGLVWAGSPAHRRDRDRSLALSALAPLADIPDVAFYSLQKGHAAPQAANPPAGMRLFDIGGTLGDFADTAAAIMALDLVVTVDTAVAHLAGALGKPVWILLSYVPDWRWLIDRDDSPWYPTARLFRQPARGAWGPVVANVAAALRGLAPGAGGGMRY